jgi:peptidoglycan/xylan/chitin deacetylase (PgdA/CDA1 family)
MHDTYGKEETARALPKIIEYLRSQGYEFRKIK